MNTFRSAMILPLLLILLLAGCKPKEQHEAHDKTGLTREAGAGPEAQEAVTTYDKVAPQLQQYAEALWANYLEVKNALVASDAAKAKQAATQLEKLSGSLDTTQLPQEQKEVYLKHQNQLRENAMHIATNDDIAHQRAHLPLLSMHTFLLLKDLGYNKSAVYYQHCPMAMDKQGANWVSENKEIRNPYFGDKMMSCGATQQSLGLNK